MTREELVAMVGNEEQADFALTLLLKSVKRPFIESVIRQELLEINSAIDEYRAEGIIYRCNGSDHVAWGKEYEPYKRENVTAFDAPDNIVEEGKALRRKCDKADILLYRRNRVRSLLAVR